MISCRTSSADDTRELAAALAGTAEAGDVILLVGDLGAGKTVFAQGFGRGLGVDERITSPTFALHNRYRGRLVLEHLDVYRLGGIDEVGDLGLEELVDPGRGGDGGGVVLVEWGDTISPALPADYLEVRLEPALQEGGAGGELDHRLVSVRPVGPSWSARARALAEVLARWTPSDRGTDGGGAAC